MSKYISEHASALLDVKTYGAPVTFTKSVAGGYDPITDTTSSPTTVSVSGFAIKKRARSQADMRKYQALNLVESVAPYLFFVPNEYGSEPPSGSTALWNGETYITRDVDPIAIDGIAIAADVVIGK